MGDATDSVKRGLKRGLLLVLALILAAIAMTAYDMLIAPKNQDPARQKAKQQPGRQDSMDIP